MDLIPVGPGFGAEVHSTSLIDIATSDRSYQETRAALEEHSVLVFRDQEVTDDVQAVFSRAFGPLERVKVGSVGAGSFYNRLHNVASDDTLVAPIHRQALTARANQLWHTDSSFKAVPALASVLSARISPRDGGETELVSTRQAWDRLPSMMQGRLRDAIVTHAYAHSRDQIDPGLMTPAERAALPPVRWRMTWRNPVNGRVALYIASHAYAIDGMGEQEAEELLARVIADATRPQYVYRHRWRQGDVLMWDNRATMHRGRMWPGDQARSMVRTTISATDADGLADVRPANGTSDTSERQIQEEAQQ
ncbi:MAG: TauD/TfdA family dioxygenase [Burkholderiaceae bacterium]|nr:TauD/TfdA family dioxygenase [Burkholderiaceae bacterium]